jgi:hypothetical protein
MPVLLAVLLAFGLLNSGEAGQERRVRQPIGTGAVVLVAAPAVIDAVADTRLPAHVLGRPDWTRSIAIAAQPGVLAAALPGGARTMWWLPSLSAALALVVAGVGVWRVRGPPPGVVHAFHITAFHTTVTAGR